MKKISYLVWFLHGKPIALYAFCVNDAAILATADKITRGEDVKIQSIENLDTGEIEISFPCQVLLEEIDFPD